MGGGATKDVWIMTSLRIRDYVLHVEHIPRVCTNCGQPTSMSYSFPFLNSSDKLPAASIKSYLKQPLYFDWYAEHIWFVFETTIIIWLICRTYRRSINKNDMLIIYVTIRRIRGLRSNMHIPSSSTCPRAGDIYWPSASQTHTVS